MAIRLQEGVPISRIQGIDVSTLIVPTLEEKIMKQNRYIGVIEHIEKDPLHKEVLYTLSDPCGQLAFAKISRLIEQSYPNSKGRVIDSITGKTLYQCCKSVVLE